jgi:hypothetical protein
MAVWYSLWSLVIFFPVLVCLDQEKSGNPDLKLKMEKRKMNSMLVIGPMYTLILQFGGAQIWAAS